MKADELSVKNAKAIINKISTLDYGNLKKLAAGMEDILKSISMNNGIFRDDLYLEMTGTCVTIIGLLKMSKLSEAKKNIEYLTGLLIQELT